jgi:hypothetical protein
MRHRQNYFLSFDILAPEVKLNVNGGSSVGTKVGIGMSLLCVGIFLILTYVIIDDYFDTGKPKITQEPVPLTRLPRMNMIQDRKFPIVFFNLLDGSPIPKVDLPKYFSVYLTKHSFFPDKPPEMVYYGVKPCAELVKENKLDTIVVENQGIVKSGYLTFGYCVDIGDADLNLGGAEEGTSEVIMFQIGPCVQGNGCKSKEDVARVGFFVTNPVAYTNYGNYKQPVQYLTEKNEHEFVNFDLTLRHKYVYQQTAIVEKKGFLSKEKTTHSFFSIGKSSTGFYSRDNNQITCAKFDDLRDFVCMPYYSMEMIVSGTSLRITREYKGIVESISEVGGMIDIIYLLFSVLYGLYYHKALKAGLVESIYGLKPSQSNRVQAADPRSKQPPLSFSQPSGGHEHQEQLRLKALKTIDKKLDIVQLSRELSAVRALAQLLFSSETQKLLPLYELECIQSDALNSEAQSGQDSSLTGKYGKGNPPAEKPPLFQDTTKSLALKSRSTKKVLLHEQSTPARNATPALHQNEPQAKDMGGDPSEGFPTDQNLLSTLRHLIECKIKESFEKVPAQNAVEIIA